MQQILSSRLSGLKRFKGLVFESGLLYVIVCFVTLAVVNAFTILLGPSSILLDLNSHSWGIFLSELIFDSWGTVGGLLGVIVLFTPVLFGIPVSQRVSVSLYFLSASVVVGIGSGVLWNRFYNASGMIPNGASSIAFAGQAIIFTLAIVGLFRLARQNTRRLGPWSKYWWNSLAIIYLTLIATTLWFILQLEPIFVPSDQFNWRVHEFCFVLGSIATLVYTLINAKPLGLVGNVPLDETLVNLRFDDLNDEKFQGRLPRYKLVFKDFHGPERMELHPELNQLFVKGFSRDQDYATIAEDFDRTLLHEMVHAELLRRKEDWRHAETSTERFNESRNLLELIPNHLDPYSND